MKKILYLDDEKDTIVEPIKKKLESTGKLEIIREKPDIYENEIDKILENASDFDGLLLDLQLNGPQEDGIQVKYQAPTLAQTIRTLATEGKLKDIPIILCSTEPKIEESYDKDFTSHNLFDWTFLKNKIDDQTIDKIVCLCEGYSSISQNESDFNRILNYDINHLDERVLSRFKSNKTSFPIHEIARSIFKDIVQPVGLLIDEDIFYARLGIDKNKSDNLKKINEVFDNVKYKGIFSNCWQRWWADSYVSLFESITNKNLSILNAEERVNELCKALKLDGIVAATPDELNSSSDFWTICQVTKKPLDPFEGYRINMREEPKAWQEYSYASLIAFASRRANVKSIEVHPLDMERLDQDIKSLS